MERNIPIYIPFKTILIKYNYTVKPRCDKDDVVMSLYLTHLKDNSSRKERNIIETLSSVQSFSLDSQCELYKQEISGPGFP